MSKISKLILIILLVAACYFIGVRLMRGRVLSDQTVRVAESTSVFENLAKPLLGIPKKIEIKGVGIVANVVEVGRTKDNVMETPSVWSDAGWFIDSSRLGGSTGNVIINGHYDDNHGRPAAFWRLKSLKLGDTVGVTDEFGRQFYFTVTKTYFVAIDAPERFDVFKYNSGTQSLTLITCGGIWLPNQSVYNKRLVVRAEVVPQF